MKKKLKKPLIIFLVIVAVIGLVWLVLWYIQSDYYEERVAMKKDRLTVYCFSSGGDMLGSYYSEEIRLKNDKQAVLTITSREHHSAKDKVTRKRIDPQALTEIEAIFKRHHMNRWAHRTISRMFIADGATDSYSFTFGDTYISFSSQHYPMRYRTVLNQIDEVVDKYSK